MSQPQSNLIKSVHHKVLQGDQKKKKMLTGQWQILKGTRDSANEIED